MDLPRSKSEKYATTVVTSWKTSWKAVAVDFTDLIELTTAVLRAKWLGWFHAKMQNTANMSIFYWPLGHWGPKKDQDKQRDSPKIGTGLSTVATVAVSPKSGCRSGSFPLTKEFCLPSFTWLATHNWAIFNFWGLISCESFCISSTWDDMESSIQLGIKIER